MHPSFSVTDKRSHRPFELAGSALLCALLTGACGGAFAERAPVQHRAGPAASYGVYSTFAPQDLVHADTRGAKLAHARRRPNIDPYLRPSARAALSPQPRATASPSPKLAATPELVATSSAPSARPPTQFAGGDLERYAARERSASKQMQYRGGDVIIIGASTLIIILLVVILVLLLT